MCGSTIGNELRDAAREFKAGVVKTGQELKELGLVSFGDDEVQLALEVTDRLIAVIADTFDEQVYFAPSVGDRLNRSILQAVGTIAGDISGIVAANKRRLAGEASVAFPDVEPLPAAEKQTDDIPF